MTEKNRTILVVDDDTNVGLIISVILKNLNYSIENIYNGKELLNYLSKKNKPSLILLDLKLPDIDGYELCKKIRENPNTSDIPIIILTGVDDMESKLKLLDIGADDYIEKPFDVRELRIRVKRLLKRKEHDSSVNPLTKLPGTPLIEEYARKKLEAGEKFSFSYVDIDNFKAYNDVYGYTRGDEVIIYLSDMLNKTLQDLNLNEYFLGHVGGDDFVIITPIDKINEILDKITYNFDREILSFYNEEHVKQGYITTKDRMNNLRQFPLMTISVAVVNVFKPINYAKIIEKIFEIKRYLKSNPDAKKKSTYHIDRRINE